MSLVQSRPRPTDTGHTEGGSGAAGTHAGLPTCTGGELRVPLVTGGTTRYANLDYAASAPALTAVAEHLEQVLPYYSSVHRGAATPHRCAPGCWSGPATPSASSWARAPTTW